jgi:hypothetical protein
VSSELDLIREIERRLDDLREADREAVKLATTKVEETLGILKERVESMNRQMIEERAEFLTEEQYQTRHGALERQVDGIQGWQYKLAGGLLFATFVAPVLAAVFVWAVTR